MLHPAAAPPSVMHDVMHGVKPYAALVVLAGEVVVAVALVDATLCEALVAVAVAFALALAFAVDEMVED